MMFDARSILQGRLCYSLHPVRLQHLLSFGVRLYIRRASSRRQAPYHYCKNAGSVHLMERRLSRTAERGSNGALTARCHLLPYTRYRYTTRYLTRDVAPAIWYSTPKLTHSHLSRRAPFRTVPYKDRSSDSNRSTVHDNPICMSHSLSFARARLPAVRCPLSTQVDGAGMCPVWFSRHLPCGPRFGCTFEQRRA